MKIELHIIQNFAPSNLNRDDSGNPKDCEFGGYRRARISSQCFKRAIHSYLDNDPELGGYMGIESKKLPIKIIEKLNEKGKNEKQVLSVVQKVLGVEFDKKNKKKTACILFLPSKCDEIMSNIIEQEWDHLFNEKGEILESDGLKRVEKEWEKLLKRKDVIDLALFGRMIADKPESKVEGATQFAHAISTNRVKMDTDFYIAIDKWADPGEGAAMMDLVNFNSSCFYRYLNFDVKQFEENLSDIKDKKVLKNAIRAFFQASIEAIPSGKQHGYAAENAPSFIFAVIRDRKLWSLTNAFEIPILPKLDEGKGLIIQSILKLDEYWGKMKKYGTEDIKAAVVFSLEDTELKNINNISSEDKYSYNKAKNLPEFLDAIISHVTVIEK